MFHTSGISQNGKPTTKREQNFLAKKECCKNATEKTEERE
jgi:hypothetical protein